MIKKAKNKAAKPAKAKVAPKKKAVKKVAKPKPEPVESVAVTSDAATYMNCPCCNKIVESFVTCAYCGMRWCKLCGVTPFNQCPSCSRILGS